ncbi:MAG: prepilin-type N-terminal cleavage/methylation protein [Hydrocarboniphaga sp.]|uniref:type IV pilin protein n=1 Tax=Hydrocarboniphaga sp. TaxID=2033016 RepID=UPI00262676D5|nr:type IV pilin protein [Hydrocarboniphaga sp.]MDB5971605.1 prepilin-type N-terminal cleavage/methylation protein [Hydrocarboniphaga sp.]
MGTPEHQGRYKSRQGRCGRSGHRSRGFTLVELMVTVVIITILASLALSSYAAYATRGRIPEATANLAVKQVQLEQFYQDNRIYTGAPACDNDSATSKYFTFSCSVLTDTAYTLLATGRGPMLGFSYTVTQDSSRATAAVPSGWSLPSPNSCWVTRQGGVC